MLKNIYKMLSEIRYMREKISNHLLLKICGVQLLGKPKVIRGILTIRSCRKLSIILGAGVMINSGKRYNIIGNDFRTVLRTIQNGQIVIGKNVGVSNSSIVSAIGITIEDDVMIGGNCQIFDTDFHPIDYEKRKLYDADGGKAKPILIKQGAFIGANVLILKGVTIGSGAVIGAGSVVAHDIPDGEMWAGNPAKCIKTLYGDN